MDAIAPYQTQVHQTQQVACHTYLIQDVLGVIFAKLELKDLSTAARVNKRWRRIATESTKPLFRELTTLMEVLKENNLPAIIVQDGPESLRGIPTIRKYLDNKRLEIITALMPIQFDILYNLNKLQPNCPILLYVLLLKTSNIPDFLSIYLKNTNKQTIHFPSFFIDYLSVLRKLKITYQSGYLLTEIWETLTKHHCNEQHLYEAALQFPRVGDYDDIHMGVCERIAISKLIGGCEKIITLADKIKLSLQYRIKNKCIEVMVEQGRVDEGFIIFNTMEEHSIQAEHQLTLGLLRQTNSELSQHIDFLIAHTPEEYNRATTKFLEMIRTGSMTHVKPLRNSLIEALSCLDSETLRTLERENTQFGKLSFLKQLFPYIEINRENNFDKLKELVSKYIKDHGITAGRMLADEASIFSPEEKIYLIDMTASNRAPLIALLSAKRYIEILGPFSQHLENFVYEYLDQFKKTIAERSNDFVDFMLYYRADYLLNDTQPEFQKINDKALRELVLWCFDHGEVRSQNKFLSWISNSQFRKQCEEELLQRSFTS